MTGKATRAGTGTMVERWNGSRWSLQHPPGGMDSGVSCPSRTACMAIGSNSVDRWDERRWLRVPTPNASISFNAVSCSSKNSCMVVGDANKGAASAQWNGHNWTVHTVPMPPGTKEIGLFDVSCVSASSCWAVGDRNPLGASFQDAGRALGRNELVGPAYARTETPGLLLDLFAVSCAKALGCTAGGDFVSNEPLVERLS